MLPCVTAVSYTHLDVYKRQILHNALSENIDAIKTENLYSFNGKAGYSLGQGQ